MVQEVLIYICSIIAVAAILSVIARMIRQPPIIAYLIAGVLVGPLVFNWIGISSPSSGLIQTFARIGVAFLLFIVGLSLDFRLLKEIGKTASLTGIIEVVVISFLGFLAAIGLGFSNFTALYIGVALAFSSTVVVVKILSDKKEMETLHGRIALGILIIQDIIAAIALMIIPLLSESNNFNIVGKQIEIAVILIIFVFLVSKFVFNKFMNYLAKSQETLFLFGIAWALALAAVFFKLGFSMEIGALIAGMSLASSKYSLDLEGKMKPLRDFFVVLFFVFFGSQLTAINKNLIFDALILSAFVILVKPIIVMITLKMFGYTKKTNFLTSISLAQVSEFSLILIMVGFSFRHLSQEIMNLAVLVSLITIGISAYAMNHSHRINDWLSGVLGVFDGKIREDRECRKKCYEVILFGYHRIGYKLLESLKNLGKNFVVVDYNPKVVLSLNKKGISSIYGDAGNKNFLADLPFEKAKLIISTIPDEQTNMLIEEATREANKKTIFVATAEQPRQAIDLYKSGVDYVLIPHHLGGEYASHLIKEFGTNKKKYDKLGKEHKIHLERSRKNSTFN
jgi:Kef-type K+ transport system membrane component KefB